MEAVQRVLGMRRRSRRGAGTIEETAARWLRRTGLTTAGASLIVAAVVGWILARLIGSRTLYLLVYGGVVILGLAWYLGRERRAIEAVRSDLPSRVLEGQIVDVELTMTATRRVAGLVLEEHLPSRLGRPRRIQLATVTPGRPVTHRYALAPRLRGAYKVGPLVAIWTDPFGFTRREAVLTEPAEVLVHPSTETVHDRPLTRQWEDPPVRPPNSKPWPSGFELYGIRRYAQGDDMRRVVWRATARTGQMMVREFEQGITDRCTILLDTDTRWHSDGDPSDTFEAAVRTAASLGVRYLKDGFGVTLMANGTDLARNLRGSRARITLLDALARVDMEDPPLRTGIDRLVREPRRDVHHIVISPHVDDAAATRLKALVDRGAYVVLVVLVWEESDPRSLATAAALGCEVVQLRPRTPLETVFAQDHGAGRR